MNASTGKPQTGPAAGERSDRTRGAAVWAGGLLLVWMLGWLAYTGFSAFTWNKFTLFDYGIYTNMVWNSGHGRLFACLVDRTYLATHLSFTLALLGPFFRLWDHPFLLWMLQWAFLAGGTALLARIAFRLGVAAPLAMSIAVFYAGYHFTQQTLLSEFHGVSLLFLLMPWLYHCLKFNRRMVWLPWMLVLGLREDAAVVILPLLLYFAVHERWRAGYLYAALSAAYMILAGTTLYPLLTGMSLLQRRHADLGAHPVAHFFYAATLRARLQALVWVVLPVLPFLWRKRWIPLLVFPSAALIQALGGATRLQHALLLHYAAPTMVCLAVALVEAVSRDEPAPVLAAGRRRALRLALALLLITGASYRIRGFLPFGRMRALCYRRVHGAGLRTLHAARRIPRGGLLLCPNQMAGFGANRRDLLDWRHYDPERHAPDLVFTDLKYIDHRVMGFRDWVTTGRFGLRYFDGTNLILERGADPAPNRLVLDALQRRMSSAPFPRSGFPNEAIRITALHWPGSETDTGQRLPSANPVALEAGDYDAVFLFAARAPAAGGMDGWGTLQIRLHGQAEELAAAEIEPVGCGSQVLRMQRVPFSLGTPAQVQAMVACRRAELWLVRADFVRRGEPLEF